MLNKISQLQKVTYEYIYDISGDKTMGVEKRSVVASGSWVEERVTIKLYSRKETGVVVLLCILRWLHRSHVGINHKNGQEQKVMAV